MVSVGTEASSGQNEKDTILLLDRSQMAEYTQFAWFWFLPSSWFETGCLSKCRWFHACCRFLLGAGLSAAGLPAQLGLQLALVQLSHVTC
jgi:hypothetical protein